MDAKGSKKRNRLSTELDLTFVSSVSFVLARAACITLSAAAYERCIQIGEDRISEEIPEARTHVDRRCHGPRGAGKGKAVVLGMPDLAKSYQIESLPVTLLIAWALTEVTPVKASGRGRDRPTTTRAPSSVATPVSEREAQVRLA